MQFFSVLSDSNGVSPLWAECRFRRFCRSKLSRTFFPSITNKLVRDDSSGKARNQGHLSASQSTLRWGHKVFSLLIGYRKAHYLVHGLHHNQSLTGGKCYESIGPGFDISNQLGIENKRFSSEPSELYHIFTLRLASR